MTRLCSKTLMFCRSRYQWPECMYGECLGQVDLTQADESCDIPKPLIVALRELGSCTDPVVGILVEAGADVGVEDYMGLSVRLSVCHPVCSAKRR